MRHEVECRAIRFLISCWDRDQHQRASGSTKGAADLHNVNFRPLLHVGIDNLVITRARSLAIERLSFMLCL